MDAAGYQGDLDLVAAYRADPTRTTAMVERLQVVPRLLAIRNVRFGRPLDGHALEDLIQDVLMLVLRKLPEYRGAGSFDGFCCRIADLEMRNRVRAVRRARRLMGALGDLDPASAAVTEGDERALSALDRLGGKEAETIRLRLFEGLDFAAIAVRTRTTPVNAKTRFYRGLVRLQASLGSPEGEEGG